jgi:hypothetical protein
MENNFSPEAATPPDNSLNPLDNFFNISFDTGAREQLRKIALWSKICSLSAFAGYLISLVVAIFGHKDYSMEAEGFTVGGYIRSGSSLPGVLTSAVLGGIINYFLYRFAVSVGEGVKRSDALKINTGFNSLRVYFKILGIGVIVIFSLIILILIIAFISGVMSAVR